MVCVCCLVVVVVGKEEEGVTYSPVESGRNREKKRNGSRPIRYIIHFSSSKSARLILRVATAPLRIFPYTSHKKNLFG